MVEHGPGAPPDGFGGVQARDLVVVDPPHGGRVGAARGDVAGQGDPDRPVRVRGDQGRVLQAEVLAQIGDLGFGPGIEHVGAVGGGDDDVVVPGAGEICGHHRADHPPQACGLPQCRSGGGVEDPDRPRSARALIGALHHLERPVAQHVRQRRRRGGAAVELGRPLQLAVGVVRLHGIGVRSAREVGAGAHHDARRTAGEETAHCRRGVHRLVGVGPADLVALGAEDPKMAPVSIGLALAGAGGLVPADGDLGLAGAVQVGDGRGGVGAVGVEERPAGQRGTALAGQCVGILAQGSGNDVRTTGLQVPHGQAGLHPGVRRGIARRIDRRGKPLLRAARAERLVAARGRVGIVPRSDEHRRCAACGRSDGRGRVDGAAPVSGRPPGHRGRSSQVVGVEVAPPVPHDDRWLALEGGRYRRRLGNGCANVR